MTEQFDDLKEIKQALLAFSDMFDVCSIYDSNSIQAPLNYGRYELVAGFGCRERLIGNFDTITSQIDTNRDWIFGYMGYESHLKFYTSKDMDITETWFFKPQIVCFIEHGDDHLHMVNNGIDETLFIALTNHLMNAGLELETPLKESIHFTPCTPKNRYLENVERIKDNILEGDYYEINYCQKFEQPESIADPLNVFDKINAKSPTPFSAFVRNEHYNILCTSPERFIFKSRKKLVSQPIKGTNQRLQGEANALQLEQLRNSEKEMAENVMIVDLVRNDMAKICETGSIKVEELFGIYPFALVNQMISTVSGQLNVGVGFGDIMKALFPMGSMTGAPKTEVMKHIALYEDAPRGLYSGCIGYIQPNGDFDFNVVIRTLVHDRVDQNTSYHVGGAITYDSIPEKEYEECLLKAEGLRKY